MGVTHSFQFSLCWAQSDVDKILIITDQWMIARFIFKFILAIQLEQYCAQESQGVLDMQWYAAQNPVSLPAGPASARTKKIWVNK